MPYKDQEQKKQYQREWLREHRQKPEVKERMRQNKRAWIQRNKSKRAEQRLKIQRWIDEYKHAHPCSCGEDHPACLDFHHLDPAHKRIEMGRANIQSFKAVQEEIKKCVVMCANCHRKLHWRKRKVLQEGASP